MAQVFSLAAFPPRVVISKKSQSRHKKSNIFYAPDLFTVSTGFSTDTSNFQTAISGFSRFSTVFSTAIPAKNCRLEVNIKDFRKFCQVRFLLFSRKFSVIFENYALCQVVPSLVSTKMIPISFSWSRIRSASAKSFAFFAAVRAATNASISAFPC